VIEMGHARALLALPFEQQAGAAARIVHGALSVRETERLVHGLLNPAKRAARRKGKPAYDADTARLENDLAERLGAVVHIEPGRQGAGRIVIRYSTLDQLDGIVERLGLARPSS
jgi:ParB family chromosome partitioning protein